MPPLPAKIECPDCRGRGSILLLIKTVPCTKCAGKGVLPATVLDIPVGNLDISLRAKTILRQLRASTVREIIRLTERDIRSHKEAGETTISEVKKALSEFGLVLRPAEPTKVAQP